MMNTEPNMTEDAELKAMQEIYAILKPLDQDSRQRVVSWVGAKLIDLPKKGTKK